MPSTNVLEFTFDKAAMVRELSLAVGSVERKATIPVLSNVLMTAGADRVSIAATDLEVGMLCGIPATVAAKGTATIPAKRFLDYIRLLPEGEVSLKVTENWWASIAAGRAKTRIAGMSAESFPELPATPDVLAPIPAATMARIIRRVLFAVSTEASRFTLNGALFEITDESFRMAATDGHRLALAEVPGGGQPTKALIPLKALREVVKIAGNLSLDAEIQFGADDNHLFFLSTDRVMMARKMTGHFPDYQRVLPKNFKGAATFGVSEMRAALDRAKLFTDERSSAARLTIADGQIGIQTQATDTGEAEEMVQAEVQGPVDVTIGFNAQYILDFLGAVETETATLKYTDAQSAAMFVPAGERANQFGDYRVVIMPMRV